MINASYVYDIGTKLRRIKSSELAFIKTLNYIQ